ncbi:hypothetical protein [Streptomyces marokkonensis]|nr:hypothetical protein [Streptomyces marokkonensis]
MRAGATRPGPQGPVGLVAAWRETHVITDAERAAPEPAGDYQPGRFG